MSPVTIVTDGRWLSRVIVRVIAWTALLFLALYLYAGLWWTITAAVGVLLVISLIRSAVRR